MMADTMNHEPSRMAVVLAGGGARGAYEAGVLSVVLPRMERAGVKPDLFVGTSAGAINAVLFAATAHLPSAEQAESILETWRTIASDDVFRSFLWTTPGAVGQWAGQLAGVPGARLTSLLDTSPLQATAHRLLDWQRLRSNVDGGHAGLAVVTTAASSNRTVVFVDHGSVSVPEPDDERPIDYVATSITAQHVLASAAIPVAFPPIRVDTPEDKAGWYLDGGVRLNTPLKPALSLGADALVVVATHPAVYQGADASDGERDGLPPDVDDVVVRVMDAALVDRMVEDVHTLGKTNELVETGGQRKGKSRPQTVVPYVFVGPDERGTLGKMAARCFDERYRGIPGLLRTLWEPDDRLLGRLLGGDGRRRGDLLSYLLFEGDFLQAAIDQGQADASAVMSSTDSTRLPWRTSAPT